MYNIAIQHICYYICVVRDVCAIYIHEGKTNKKLNTRPNFEVKITYTIRPLVQYYWNTTRIGHCDRIKFYSNTKKSPKAVCRTHASYRIRLSLITSIVYTQSLYTHCAPWELGAWNMNGIVPYISAKWDRYLLHHIAMKENPGSFFYIFLYYNIHSLRPSVWFSSKYFCTIVLGRGHGTS